MYLIKNDLRSLFGSEAVEGTVKKNGSTCYTVGAIMSATTGHEMSRYCDSEE